MEVLSSDHLDKHFANVTLRLIYHLPPFSVADHQVRLPCPESDLLNFCASASHSVRDECALSFEKCLQANPSLLLYSLEQFRQVNKDVPRSIDEVIQWLAVNNRPFQHSPEMLVFEKSQEGLSEVLLAFQQRPKKLRKRLRAFLRCVSDLSKSESRRFVAELVSDEFVSSFTEHPSLNIAAPGKPTKSKERKSAANHHWFEQPLLDSMDSSGSVVALWTGIASLLDFRHDFDETLKQEKLKSLKQLAYGASHEINNPLANIASRAQALMMCEENKERRHRLSVIYSQAMRGHEMISDMMLFAHPPKISCELTDIKQIALEQMREISAELKSREIKIDIRQYPDVEMCMADPVSLAIAIKALLKNSMEAIGTKGRVRIRIWRKNETSIGIAIADNGPGVVQDHQKHLFDPFFSGREAGRGIGFGLSKAWRIIDLHGGNLTLDRSFEGGARFEIEMPIATSLGKSQDGCRIDNLRAA